MLAQLGMPIPKGGAATEAVESGNRQHRAPGAVQKPSPCRGITVIIYRVKIRRGAFSPIQGPETTAESYRTIKEVLSFEKLRRTLVRFLSRIRIAAVAMYQLNGSAVFGLSVSVSG